MPGRQAFGGCMGGGMGNGQMNGRMGWQGGNQRGAMPGPFLPGMGMGMGMGVPMGPPMPFMPPGMGMQGRSPTALWVNPALSEAGGRTFSGQACSCIQRDEGLCLCAVMERIRRLSFPRPWDEVCSQCLSPHHYLLCRNALRP